MSDARSRRWLYAAGASMFLGVAGATAQTPPSAPIPSPTPVPLESQRPVPPEKMPPSRPSPNDTPRSDVLPGLKNVDGVITPAPGTDPGIALPTPPTNDSQIMTPPPPQSLNPPATLSK